MFPAKQIHYHPALAVMIAAAGYLNYAGKEIWKQGDIGVADMGSLELSDEESDGRKSGALIGVIQDILSPEPMIHK